MCSFIFILIRAVTNEVKTAHVAQYIEQHVTRNHFTFWLTDTASLWLQNHTAFQFCVECAEFVIDEDFPDIHDSCLARLRHEQQLERETEAEHEIYQIEAWKDEEPYEKYDALPPMSLDDYFALREQLDQEAMHPDTDEYDDYPDEPHEDEACPDCGYSPCECREEDPLKGDVEPTGGYPEESCLVPTGYGTFEWVYYDPTDASTWPFTHDEWGDEEN